MAPKSADNCTMQVSEELNCRTPFGTLGVGRLAPPEDGQTVTEFDRGCHERLSRRRPGCGMRARGVGGAGLG
eukprot:534854-Alexandrium_andersonii.AAC.1